MNNEKNYKSGMQVITFFPTRQNISWENHHLVIK